jgi:hypothetical protein
MNDMKKTIAILLVLAISMVGIFAVAGGATSSFDVSTQVTGLNYLAITATEFLGSNMNAWNSHNETQITSPVSLNTGTATDVAYLNVINNKRNGVLVYIQADKMVSLENSATNTYLIDYKATVNSVEYDTDSETVGSFKEIITTTESAATHSLFMDSYAINIDIDDTDLENAPEDTYSGTITFNFTGA